MSVSVYAKIIHVVVVPAPVTYLRRDHQEPVLVVMNSISLVVHVKDVSDLRGKTRNREILAVQVGDEDIIFSEAFSEVVEATVGVFVEQDENKRGCIASGWRRGHRTDGCRADCLETRSHGNRR